ncbi:MAG: DUF3185 domain-containing protein [Bacteroidetes bacterium]|nr:DUF3185 domain-containing protein [Bacteroidota bacterium]
MKGLAIVGMLLIVLGIGALVYGGISYTTDEKVLDVGPLEAEVEKEHNIPMSPLLGFVAIAAGGVMLLYSRK